MTDQEIINKLASFKEAIVNLKNKKDELKERYKQLKEYCDSVQLKLDEAVRENENLKTQISDLKSLSQESQEKDEQAKNAFLQEISKVIEDANKALQDE